MAKTALNFLTGLAFTITLFTAGPALAAEDGQMALVLHVDNYARIPPDYLTRAEAVATNIYAAAGIAVTWSNDDPNTVLPIDDARHLRVLLLCADMTNTKTRKDHVPDNVLGQAAHGSTRAYIFTYRVRAVAFKKQQPFEAVLGHVIAHEVGHLLLPPFSHSTSGIMRENLQFGSMRLETFTPIQSEEIRMALNR
jgi:hypothetical protein